MKEKRQQIVTELQQIKDSDHMRRILEFIIFLKEMESEE